MRLVAVLARGVVPLRGRMRHALLLPLLGACVATTPRYSQDLEVSFAHRDHRLLETPRLEVVYPEAFRADALRIARDLDACVARLQEAVKAPAGEKVRVAITASSYNNAFVIPRLAGVPPSMVLPLRLNLELFNLFDLGTGDVEAVSCHEALHYVQMESTTGFWQAANDVFGDVMSTNAFLEPWFHEGLATYVEGKLTGGGRPHSPYFRAAFEAGVASQGSEIRAGDLNAAAREPLPFGGQYLVGAHFVDFLARRHGEDRLWQLVRVQGGSLLSPFGVTLRFSSVYGRTIGGLISQYDEELRATVRPRARPADQRVIAGGLGYLGRLAAGTAGESALIAAGLDRVPTLTVREADGRVRFSRPVTSILPPRTWIQAGPVTTSGLAFSRDGRFLYLVSADLAADGSDRFVLRRLDARDGDELATWPLVGMGGDVTPDGSAYVYAASIGARPALVRLDLRSGRNDTIVTFDPGESISPPALSPSGRRLAFARRGSRGFEIWLRDGGRYTRLTEDDVFDYAPRFLDEETLVFAREIEGRAQAALLHLPDRRIAQVTAAPWAVLDPVPGGDGLLFLNKDGWGWTLDTAPIEVWDSAPPRPEPPPAVAPPLEVVEDRPYSVFPELLVPRSRGLFLTGLVISRERLHPVFSAWLGGTDRLALHTWGGTVTVGTLDRELGFDVGYSNYLLAPWLVSVNAARRVGTSDLQGGGVERIEQREVAIDVSRGFWTTFVQAGAVGLQRFDEWPGNRLEARLVGPRLGLSWSATESTPYAGVRRGLAVDAATQVFPEALGSDFDLTDGAAGATVWLPLPFLERQRFALGARARRIWGPAPGMLEVGGPAAGQLYPRQDSGRPDPLFLPGLALSEPLRGFEDVSFRATRLFVGSAAWTYPLVIDRGDSSTLLLLPSIFLRQLELEGFATLARIDDATFAAGGPSLRLRTVFGSLAGLSVSYQLAFRTGGLDPVQVVVLSSP